MKTINMKSLKLTLLALVTLFAGFKELKACHGQPLVNYVVTPGPLGITINASSNAATCGCGPYWLQTELSCTAAFNGIQPACLTAKLKNWNQAGTSYVSFPYFNSLLNVPNYNVGAGWPDNCALEPYNSIFIPYANLCPGKTYFIRSREMVMAGGPFPGAPSLGAWTPAQQFTVPGVLPPPGGGALTLGLNAAPPSVFCGGGTMLTPTWAGSCAGSCGPNFPSCEATTTIVPSYSFVATNPVLPGNVTTTVVPAATSASIINIPNLPSTTSFSVYYVYKVITPISVSYSATSGPNAFPINMGSNTNSFVTAAANSVYMNAFLNCSIAPCTITQPGIVNVNVIMNLPVSNVTVTPNTCMSSPSFTFGDNNNAIPGMNYNWNFGDATTGVGNPVVHNYLAPGIYTVTLTKSGGPTCAPVVSTVTVEVYPNPTSTLSVNSPVCIGGTISFTNTVTNANTYNWSGPNVFTSTLQNPVISNATANMGGLYNCTVTSANGCTVSSNINVATFQAPLLANSNGPVCTGSSLSLTASGSGNYSWSGPNSFTSTSQNPSFIPMSSLSSGNYIVNALLAGNCTASATVAVVVNTTNVTASNNGPICSGNTAQLNAVGVGAFSWTGPNGFTSQLQNPSFLNASTNLSGVYYVTITSPAGCVKTATTNLTVQAPQILNPKSTGTICENGTVYLEAMNGSGVSYQWVGPNGFASSNANTAVVDATPAGTGIYTVTLINSIGCSASGTVAVLVNPKPNVDIDMSKAISGCAPVNNVEFNAVTNSLVGINFSWTLGNGSVNTTSNPKNINYPNAGTYTIGVIATDVKGCSNKINKVLEVYPVPVVSYSNTSANWTNPMVNFTDMSTNGNITSWYWTFGIGPDVYSTSQHPNYNYPDSGSYNVTLKVKTDKGCENMLMKKVFIADESSVFIPNAFSPNGDGQNDVFTVIGNSVTKFEMLIFNRGGNLVFKSTDINKGWDGTFKGQVSENNVYVYKISYVGKDSKSHTASGSVTLVK
jgi:gliding motility-associated-like protein